MNNKKPIIFVSLEDDLHLGNTTDQPNVERGVKNEILNQGANIANNTNNTSNDIMRAMKSAYTGISTLLEQDALSKYDISDAFINFFRDASINRKTINDLNAVKGTIESVSESVFDEAVIGQAASANKNAKANKPEKAEKPAPVPLTVGAAAANNANIASAENGSGGSNTQNTVERTAAAVQPIEEEQPQSAPPSAPPQQADKQGFDFKNKKFLIAIACVCVVAVIGIIIGVSGGETLSGTYTGEWKNNRPEGRGTMKYYNGNVYEGEWKDNAWNGKGTYTNTNGAVYEGEVSGGYFNGQGTMKYAGGSSYTGQWADSKREGEGVYTFPEGSVLKGTWKNDKCNGEGVLTKADGTVQEGVWKDDEYIGDPNDFGAPKNITAEYKDDNNVRLAWDAVPGAEKYQLYVYFNPELQNCQGSMEPGSNAMVLNNVILDYDYYCTLRAVTTTDEGKTKYSEWIYINFKRINEDDVSIYFGGWKDGKRDGMGTQINPGGTNYTGEWKDGEFVG